MKKKIALGARWAALTRLAKTCRGTKRMDKSDTQGVPMRQKHDPNNCAGCMYSPDPDRVGHCYMWKTEPVGRCYQHKLRPPVATATQTKQQSSSRLPHENT